MPHAALSREASLDATRAWLGSLVRAVPDFPKPGILFRDVTTLFKHPEGFATAIDLLAGAAPRGVSKLAAMESRGFILGGALAVRLGIGFVPIRKPGKLPGEHFGHDYELEYGSDRLELHCDAIGAGEKVLIVDDLIATGGTAQAAGRLVELAGGQVAGFQFLIDLPDLGGRAKLEQQGWQTYSLLAFDGH